MPEATFSPACAAPRTPCSGLKSATRSMAGCARSRSTLLTPLRSTPVWLVNSATRFPLSDSSRSESKTSIPGVICLIGTAIDLTASSAFGWTGSAATAAIGSSAIVKTKENRITKGYWKTACAAKKKGRRFPSSPLCVHCRNALSARDIRQINLKAWAH